MLLFFLKYFPYSYIILGFISFSPAKHCDKVLRQFAKEAANRSDLPKPTELTDEYMYKIFNEYKDSYISSYSLPKFLPFHIHTCKQESYNINIYESEFFEINWQHIFGEQAYKQFCNTYLYQFLAVRGKHLLLIYMLENYPHVIYSYMTPEAWKRFYDLLFKDKFLDDVNAFRPFKEYLLTYADQA